MTKQLLLTIFLLLTLLSTALPVAAHGDDGPADNHDSEMVSSSTQWPLLLGALVVGGATAGGMKVTRRRALSVFQLAITGLGVATGVIHLIVGLRGDTLLILNGIGYLGLVGLLYLPLSLPIKSRQPLRIGLVLYTLVTLIGYFVTHNSFDAVGLATKAIEVLLIAALAFQIRRTIQRTS